ncbi:MAG: pseudouridine synthase [Firmicutes bacterium]|nr:pseudouridine synthase [Bacillota bacterium]
MKIRVQRILQQAELGSRRACEEWIRQGRVAVNGQVARVGDVADPTVDVVTLDGERVTPKTQPRVYLALNKPPGVTTTLRDPHAERTVSDLIPDRFGRVFPVGRLDRESEGLLLLTNDGELAHALMHPSSQVPKVYDVWVQGVPGHSHLDRIRRGIVFDDGMAKPDEVRLVSVRDHQARLRVTLHEGRKREIRRLFFSIGHPVTRLVRIQYGPVRLEGLAPGEVRALTQREVQDLKALIGLGKERTTNGHGLYRRQRQPGGQKHRSGESLSPKRPRYSFGHTRGNSERPHR